MKNLIEKAFFLKKVKIFSDLELELLLAIGEKLHEDAYEANEKVFIPGQVANRIYLIAEGSVEIFDGPMRPIALLHPGELFGDESIFNEQPRAYTAICKTNVLFYTLSRSQFLSIISECPSVAVLLLQAYSHELPCRQKNSKRPSPL